MSFSMSNERKKREEISGFMKKEIREFKIIKKRLDVLWVILSFYTFF